jgi:hypothetical protein
MAAPTPIRFNAGALAATPPLLHAGSGQNHNIGSGVFTATLAPANALAHSQQQAYAKEQADLQARVNALALAQAQAQAQANALAKQHAQAQAQVNALAKQHAQAEAQAHALAQQHAQALVLLDAQKAKTTNPLLPSIFGPGPANASYSVMQNARGTFAASQPIPIPIPRAAEPKVYQLAGGAKK